MFVCLFVCFVLWRQRLTQLLSYNPWQIQKVVLRYLASARWPVLILLWTFGVYASTFHNNRLNILIYVWDAAVGLIFVEPVDVRASQVSAFETLFWCLVSSMWTWDCYHLDEQTRPQTGAVFKQCLWEDVQRFSVKCRRSDLLASGIPVRFVTFIMRRQLVVISHMDHEQMSESLCCSGNRKLKSCISHILSYWWSSELMSLAAREETTGLTTILFSTFCGV